MPAVLQEATNFRTLRVWHPAILGCREWRVRFRVRTKLSKPLSFFLRFSDQPYEEAIVVSPQPVRNRWAEAIPQSWTQRTQVVLVVNVTAGLPERTDMRTRDCMPRRMLLAVMFMLIMGVPSRAQHQPSFKTIDAPKAGISYGYGTQVEEVNPSGLIIGYYVGYDNIVHSFLRTVDNKFITIDGPVCAAGQTSMCVPQSMPDSADPYAPPNTWLNESAPGTYAAAVDAMGTVTGYYVDANGVAYSYLSIGSGPSSILQRRRPFTTFITIRFRRVSRAW